LAHIRGKAIKYKKNNTQVEHPTVYEPTVKKLQTNTFTATPHAMAARQCFNGTSAYQRTSRASKPHPIININNNNNKNTRYTASFP